MAALALGSCAEGVTETDEYQQGYDDATSELTTRIDELESALADY